MSNIEEASGKEGLMDREQDEHLASRNVVEGLQAEASQQQTTDSPLSSLEKYCNENPSASECLIYEE